MAKDLWSCSSYKYLGRTYSLVYEDSKYRVFLATQSPASYVEAEVYMKTESHIAFGQSAWYFIGVSHDSLERCLLKKFGISVNFGNGQIPRS